MYINTVNNSLFLRNQVLRNNNFQSSNISGIARPDPTCLFSTKDGKTRVDIKDLYDLLDLDSLLDQGGFGKNATSVDEICLNYESNCTGLDSVIRGAERELVELLFFVFPRANSISVVINGKTLETFPKKDALSLAEKVHKEIDSRNNRSQRTNRTRRPRRSRIA